MRHVLFTVLFVCCAALRGADQPANPPTPEMQKAMELAKPGPEHQHLLSMAGRWNVACKMWMEPGGSPKESTGNATITPILDNRFIRQDFTGSFMGQTFTGLGIDGFDRIRREYTATWMDSISTGTMHMKGTSTDNGKTITYRGEYSCPMTGAIIPSRSVHTMVDDNTMRFEMFDIRNGQENKSMELTYTRVRQ